MRSSSHVPIHRSGRPTVPAETRALYAARFRALRERRGMRQDDVADRSGPHATLQRTLLSRTDVNKLATGKSGWTGRPPIAGLAAAFGLESRDVEAYILEGSLSLDEIDRRCKAPLGPLPVARDVVVVPDPPPPEAHGDRVRRIGAELGASAERVDVVLAMAAKGGMGRLKDDQVRDLFREAAVPERKRVTKRVTAEENRAAVDEMEGHVGARGRRPR
jgi:transcriptional regulator with XRE-family HTH domain